MFEFEERPGLQVDSDDHGATLRIEYGGAVDWLELGHCPKAAAIVRFGKWVRKQVKIHDVSNSQNRAR